MPPSRCLHCRFYISYYDVTVKRSSNGDGTTRKIHTSGGCKTSSADKKSRDVKSPSNGRLRSFEMNTSNGRAGIMESLIA
ncbi:hypothetical protein EVAR_99647_1 [Eumeta japonica]|uniref:Uncharacterized protein n=1 Tax=Eumeta variegata TaxID=151549 RepID=A0A4C1ZJJ3_EUMVA|nr:hypothetical protein EVAR_99647_1 [Eumeta japonica]